MPLASALGQRVRLGADMLGPHADADDPRRNTPQERKSVEQLHHKRRLGWCIRVEDFVDQPLLDGAEELGLRFDVMILSPKAGGVGLNLSAADTVIHFDPWWNPAVEAQATDRAHRIGQSRVVTAYKLICRNTVEEKILNLQRKKRAVIDATVESEEPLMTSLSTDEIRDLIMG